MLAEPQRAICRNSRRGIHSLIMLLCPPALCAQANSGTRTGASTAADHLRLQRRWPPEQSAPSVARNDGADRRVWPSLRYTCSIWPCAGRRGEGPMPQPNHPPSRGPSNKDKRKNKQPRGVGRQRRADLKPGANRGRPSSMGTGLGRGKTQATDQYALDLRARSFVGRARVCPVA